MEKNNGKIAIAIVAMFVVALSVVGFTYAYFTATVKGNEKDTSVKVTAGELSIVYSSGKTLTAQNVVPGWTSDGKHYYDIEYSKTDSGQRDENNNIIYAISAVSTDEHNEKSTGGAPKTADGIADRVPFTVRNADENDGDTKYIIKLNNINNGITDAADAKHLWVTLYSTATSDSGTTYTPIWSGNLAAGTGSGSQIIVPSARTIANDGPEQTYAVGLTYQNVTDGEQSAKGATISATVEVVGVQENKAGKWVDADGTEITFPEGNTTDYATVLETTNAAS